MLPSTRLIGRSSTKANSNCGYDSKTTVALASASTAEIPREGTHTPRRSESKFERRMNENMVPFSEPAPSSREEGDPSAKGRSSGPSMTRGASQMSKSKPIGNRTSQIRRLSRVPDSARASIGRSVRGSFTICIIPDSGCRPQFGGRSHASNDGKKGTLLQQAKRAGRNRGRG